VASRCSPTRSTSFTTSKGIGGHSENLMAHPSTPSAAEGRERVLVDPGISVVEAAHPTWLFAPARRWQHCVVPSPPSAWSKQARACALPEGHPSRGRDKTRWPACSDRDVGRRNPPRGTEDARDVNALPSVRRAVSERDSLSRRLGPPEVGGHARAIS
jgi:hypothetical protein